MSTYTLFGKEVSFSKAADRYFFMLKAFEAAVEGASTDFKNFYHNSGNISNVLDDYIDAVYAITKSWVTDYLYETLKKAEIYDVSEEKFTEACCDLSSAESCYDCIADKYNEIVGDLADAKQYRANRKASRTQYGWMSSTDWGAMTNAAMTAGTLNVMSGIGHSIANGIGNLGSSISAAASKKALYNNEKTVEVLDLGVRECVKNIFLRFMDFVNEYKEDEGEELWYDGSVYDSDKADTLLKNSQEVEGKEKELLFKAFSVCPYHYDVSETIFLKFDEERKNIFEIAKKYKNDLTPILRKSISILYTEEAKNSEEKAQEAKSKIKNFMKEYGITEDETLDQIEYDCLIRLCSPYQDSVPGENKTLLDSIIAYDATDDNKSIVVEELKIWELADRYEVEFDEDEKEEIVSSFIEWAKSKKLLDNQTILQKAKFIIKGLKIGESEALDDFEYDILDEFASEYENLPVGEADEIIQKIDSCFVSDSSKKEYIYDNDIWELAKKYRVEFDDDEKEIIVYNAFSRMVKEKDTADERNIIIKLTDILKALDIMDDSGEILPDKREVLYKSLSGIKSAMEEYENSVKDSSSGMASTINRDVERIISNTGITFMTTSLTYREDHIWDNVQKLKYCTMTDDEHPFVIYDSHPIMNPYAYGFCLTDKRLIVKQETSRFEVQIENIVSFAKKGFLSSKILVNTKSGVKEIDAENLSELQKFADCLNCVIKALPSLKRKSQEADGESYKEYIKKCVSSIESHPFLVEYFSAEKIVSEIYAKAEEISSTQQPNNEIPVQSVDAELNISEDLKTKINEHLAPLIRSQQTEEAIKQLSWILNCDHSKAEMYINSLSNDCVDLTPQATQPAGTDTNNQKIEATYWLCSCGNTGNGNFCMKCGAKKETGTLLWSCTCGSLNKGKFCSKCGTPRKE